MSIALKCKDLTSFGHAIAAATTLEDARKIFIEMVEAFDFKSKKAAYIREAKAFNGHRNRFTKWSWDVILMSQGLGVVKV